MYTLTMPSHEGAGIERVLFARLDRAIGYAVRRQRALPAAAAVEITDAGGAIAWPPTEEETA